MDGNIYKKDAIARIEHFDTITGQLRPWHGLILSTSTMHAVSDVGADRLKQFIKVGTTLYCLAYDDGSPANTPTIGKWSSYTWTGTGAPGTFSSVATSLEPRMAYYNSFILGFWNGSHIWSMTTGGTFNGTYKALTYTAGTVTDPIIHSKDNIMYFGYMASSIGYIGTLNTSGTVNSAALTLPTNFKPTSIAEMENYILIVGYDTNSGQATAYVWDRDSSLTTVTAKYDLGYEIPYHCFAPGGVPIIVTSREDSGNTEFEEKPILSVLTPIGEKMEPIDQFQFSGLVMNGYGKFIDRDKLYFAAKAKSVDEATNRNVVFSVDYRGRLIVELNASVNTTFTNAVTGVFRDGQGFWLAADSDGAWATENNWITTGSFETGVIRSEELSQNLNFRGAIVTCEPLISGASIVIKGRKNDETTWTTLATFDTDNGVKFALAGMIAKNALSGLDRAKQVQLRVESVGGAIITGFQAAFDPVSDENNTL